MERSRGAKRPLKIRIEPHDQETPLQAVDTCQLQAGPQSCLPRPLVLPEIPLLSAPKDGTMKQNRRGLKGKEEGRRGEKERGTWRGGRETEVKQVGDRL